MLLADGVRDIVGCDRWGALYQRRRFVPDAADRAADGASFPDSPIWRWYAAAYQSAWVRGTLRDALRGADVFIGVSAPNLLTAADLRTMAADPMVFALANPDPEVSYEEAEGHARIIATGRSDYPNQVNNVLAFPGMFRGALDAAPRALPRG